MLFVSAEFFVFVCIVIPLYFFIPYRWRIHYLLITSCLFYLHSGIFPLILLLVSTAIDYAIALRIDRSESIQQRRRWLMLSLVANIGILFFFKYLSFFAASLADVLNGFHVAVDTGAAANVPLPLGISFYTFMKIAYVVDVYRNKIRAEANIITLSTFVTFFPHIDSGPIDRADQLIPQFARKANFDEKAFVEGGRLILWGAFKKIVIADRLAIYVNGIYDQPQNHTGLPLLIATLFLAFQIYADFSGYTDMALGIGRMLGFDLAKNFRQPYLSTSVLEFWRSWHISLTSWIREYLFFPLSRYLLVKFNRRFSWLIEIAAYLIVMSLVGLWHGASLTFVVWGLLHGIFMSFESVSNRLRLRMPGPSRVRTPVRIAMTFTVVTFAWIFFRANNLDDAFYILGHMFDFSSGFQSLTAPFDANDSVVAVLGVVKPFQINGRILQLIISFVLISVLLVADYIDEHYPSGQLPQRLYRGRWAFYYAAVFAILLFGAWGTQSFIYFQF